MSPNSPQFQPNEQLVRATLEAMRGKRVLIIGDTMLDHYVWGSVHRISPEAPVPIVQTEHEEYRLGGAANVMLNVHACGATPILVSVIGSDEAGNVFLERLRQISLQSAAHIIRSLTRPTTVKTRILAQQQQILRIDREVSTETEHEMQMQVLEQVQVAISEHKPDIVLFEDYDKGVLTEWLIMECIELAKKHAIPVVVDPKKRNFYAYKGVHLFKPNLKELRDAVPFEVKAEPQDLQKACDYLRDQLGHEMTMVTLSAQGVYLEQNGFGRLYPTLPVQVADVSGAGDTVMAVVALALTHTREHYILAHLANKAGGQVVAKTGVVPVDWGQLFE
jgi:D-glycero-beta-D-manno-heptose-7-phosphate kinase